VKRFLRFVALPAAIVAFAVKMWASVETTPSSPVVPDNVLSRYFETEQSHRQDLRGASMDVEIDASIPKLKQHGRLHALRRISQVGTVTYHAIAFQGDSAVKHQIIARYLDAERQAQTHQNLSITPENYKFRFKGERIVSDRRVYVFELNPRHRQIGLFKGEMWLDKASYLPVYEKGRLVKNPSIFFKKVEFERAFAIENGLSVPVRTASVIKTRLVGKIELNVNYSNFELDTTQPANADSAPVAQTVAASQPSSQSPSAPYAPQE
jgi:hypothetical protein